MTGFSSVISDFEYLYMIRQNSNDALIALMLKYDALLWKVSHVNFNLQKPEGIQVQDLYQEARLGFIESLYTYQENKAVGLAHYVKICVETHVKSALRKCRSHSYRMLDTSFSLDISISEDNSLTLQDMVECDNLDYNPVYRANMNDCLKTLNQRLKQLTDLEKTVYEYWNKGYSYQEISKKVNCSAKFVDNTVQKIKRVALQK